MHFNAISIVSVLYVFSGGFPGMFVSVSDSFPENVAYWVVHWSNG